MKKILIICLLILTGCTSTDSAVTSNTTTTPSISPTPTTLTTFAPSTDENPFENDDSSYIQCDQLLFIDDLIGPVTIDTSIDSITLNNPLNSSINNQITIQKLSDPYYRISRQYSLNYDFTYTKNNTERHATLEIINYRNHPEAHNNNTYDCHLTVPDSDNDKSYHFYGMPSNKQIYILLDNITDEFSSNTDGLYFTDSLQQKIIEYLVDAEDTINTLDEKNLDYAYEYISTMFDQHYFLSRTYFPHYFIETIISDYLYFPSCDLSFFTQPDPVMRDVNYFNGDDITTGYFNKVKANQIAILVDDDTNIMTVVISHRDVIFQAGGGDFISVHMIDLKNNQILDYEDILTKFNLNETKITNFFNENQDNIFTDGTNYAMLKNDPSKFVAVCDNNIYFVLYQTAEHGYNVLMPLPLDEFTN